MLSKYEPEEPLIKREFFHDEASGEDSEEEVNFRNDGKAVNKAIKEQEEAEAKAKKEAAQIKKLEEDAKKSPEAAAKLAALKKQSEVKVVEVVDLDEFRIDYSSTEEHLKTTFNEDKQMAGRLYESLTGGQSGDDVFQKTKLFGELGVKNLTYTDRKKKVIDKFKKKSADPFEVQKVKGLFKLKGETMENEVIDIESLPSVERLEKETIDVSRKAKKIDEKEIEQQYIQELPEEQRQYLSMTDKQMRQLGNKRYTELMELRNKIKSDIEEKISMIKEKEREKSDINMVLSNKATTEDSNPFLKLQTDEGDNFMPVAK